MRPVRHLPVIYGRGILGWHRTIGLLLSCNAVVRAVAVGTVVEALDPQILVTPHRPARA
jgi:hypothetical protein